MLFVPEGISGYRQMGGVSKKNGVVLASPKSGIGCAYPVEGVQGIRRSVQGFAEGGVRVRCGSGAGGLRVHAGSWAGACRHALGRARGNRQPVLCMRACVRQCMPMYADVCGHARTRKGERESGRIIRHLWKTFANHGDYTHGAMFVFGGKRRGHSLYSAGE